MMFTGPTSEVVPWFSSTLGYAYDSQLHGVTSDWVMDLVFVTFNKPKVRSPGWSCLHCSVCTACCRASGCRLAISCWAAK